MLGSRPRACKVFAFGLACACACAFVAWPGAARGDERGDSETLARARAAIESVDYDAALALVRPLLASPTARVRASALEITAVANLLTGHQVAGRQALEGLYTLAPAFLLDDPTLPPRVTSEFEAAGARPRARAVTPIVQPVLGDPAAFELRSAGATRSVAVACRTSAGEPFVAVETTPTSGGWRFELPRSAPTTCHAVALDEEGVAIGRLGTARSPFELRPQASTVSRAAERTSSGGPVTTRWWFWSGVVAVVVAGATLTFVATRPAEPALPRSEVTISALRSAAIAW
jgi:hypothetical protein